MAAAATQAIEKALPKFAIRAAVEPSSVDPEARTVELVWTTGARVLRGVFDRYWEELSTSPEQVRMGRLNSGAAPLLNSHDNFDLRGQLGVVEEAWFKGGEGNARVRFARAEDDEDADKIFRKVRDGIIRNVSVGYLVHRLEKVEEAADGIPVLRATDWEPLEISFVPIPADAGTTVRSGEPTYPCIVVGIGGTEERIFMANKPDTTAAAERATAATEPNTGAAERATDPDLAAVRREAAEAERSRAAAIRRAGRMLDMDESFVERHISDGTTIDRFHVLAIDLRAERPPIVSDAGRAVIAPGEDARAKWLRGAGDWIITRAAVADKVESAAAARGESYRCDPGEFRGKTLVDLAALALERSGVSTHGMDRCDVVGKALAFRGGYNTTGDFPALLANTLNKVLLAAYETTPDTWRQFCAVGSVTDFRPYPRYRMGSFAALSKVREHGEYKNQQIPDARKETITADTAGNMIALSRQAIINDDMGAFSRLATMLGRAARLSIEVDVYALLKENSGLGPRMGDGKTLFHADHKNIGAASELSVAGLDADRIVMASQKDESGNEILDLRPAILLVPIGLGGDARVINDAQFDTDDIDGTTKQNKFMKPNKVRGLFNTIVDTPRFEGTRRYSFADPSVAPTIEVVFLEGRQSPILEARDGWRTDGVEWKVTFDFGVGAIDYRGAVTNAGT